MFSSTSLKNSSTLKKPIKQASFNSEPFELPPLIISTSTGKLISLTEAFSDHYGVLFFFPGFKAGKSIPIPAFWGCTSESCAYNDNLAAFELRRTKIFGVTSQKSLHVNEAIQEHHLTYPILIDSTLAHALGVCTWVSSTETYLNRDTIIVGPGGKILDSIRAIDLSDEAEYSSEKKTKAHIADVLIRLDNILKISHSCTSR